MVGMGGQGARWMKRGNAVALSAPSGAYLTRVVHLSNVSLRFEIWDTAGQEKYHSIMALYYRGAHVVLLVYDISKRVTERR